MADDNPLKRLKDRLDQSPRKKAPSKANHTFYLNQDVFAEFRRYCQIKGVKPSEMIDNLMALWLEEVQHDMPAAPKVSGE